MAYPWEIEAVLIEAYSQGIALVRHCSGSYSVFTPTFRAGVPSVREAYEILEDYCVHRVSEL